MALDDLVEDKGGTVDDGREYDIERKDYLTGFKIRLTFSVPEKENDRYLQTWISNCVDDDTDTPRTRSDLTNDAVEEIMDNAIERVERDYPEASLKWARINGIHSARYIELEE